MVKTFFGFYAVACRNGVAEFMAKNEIFRGLPGSNHSKPRTVRSLAGAPVVTRIGVRGRLGQEKCWEQERESP